MGTARVMLSAICALGALSVAGQPAFGATSGASRAPACPELVDGDGDGFPDDGLEAGGRCRQDECPAVAVRGSANGCPLADDPVRRHAPRIWLHSRERYGPRSAREFLRESRLMWGDDVVDEELTTDEFSRLGAACRLFGNCYAYDGLRPPRLTDEHTRPYDAGRPLEEREGFALDFDGDRESRGVRAPVYYVYRPRAFVAYWFFYAYSKQAHVGHEGDWEHVVVLLDDENRAHSLEHFFHGSSRTVRWNAEGPPEVFSAWSTHATYLRSGLHLRHGDMAGRGRRWLAREWLLNAEAQPWYGYGGAWGALGSSRNRTGPLGPSRFKANCTGCPR